MAVATITVAKKVGKLMRVLVLNHLIIIPEKTDNVVRIFT